MGYWKDMENGPGQSDRCRSGVQKLTVVNVLHGKKDGTEFVSSKGDPQMLLVFENEHEEECTCMFTLSEKAAWTVYKFISRAGLDIDQMEADGVTIETFHDLDFCRKQLIGRSVWADVEFRTGKNGKEYADLSFMHESELPVDVLKKKPSVIFQPALDPIRPDEDEIPF